MSHPQSVRPHVRNGYRNRSTPDVERPRRARFVTHRCDTASGCQGLSRQGRSTPGECVFKRAVRAALACPADGRSFHGHDPAHTRQGCAPAPLRAPRPAARTPLSRSEAVSRYVDPLFFRPSFQGCAAGTTWRAFARSVFPPHSHDAMDFVASSVEHATGHRGECRQRRPLAASASSSASTKGASLRVAARSPFTRDQTVGARRRNSRRHAPGVRRPVRTDRIGNEADCRSLVIRRHVLKTREMADTDIRAVALKAARSLPSSAKSATLPVLRTLLSSELSPDFLERQRS